MICYTDGSAHPNPGPGGYGVVVYDDAGNLINCYQHQDLKTTNNEQELKAILYCMINYGVNINSENDNFTLSIPIVYSDSSYAINTLSTWMFSWARNNWIKSDKKIPENLNLIQAYYDLYNKGYRIDLKKVNGHNGIEGNELADKLARGLVDPTEVIKKYGINLQSNKLDK